MSDELKPCPFNVGDKVQLVDIGFHNPQIIIGYEINRFGEYEYSLAESIENGCPVGVTTNVGEKYFTLVDEGRSTITEHIQNIPVDGELEENSVCRNFRRTAKEYLTYRSGS